MANHSSRRWFLGTLAAAAAGWPRASAAQSGEAPGRRAYVSSDGILKVGFLWSQSGHLAIIEKPSVDVGMFWIDQVNRSGGVAGLKVEPIVIDAHSDIKTYRTGARALIEAGVVAIFGGYTSASRRAVMPLVTLADHIFYYPTCYEGRECWQHIICTGPIANQHSFDLIPYMTSRFGPRAYFVGSNYVWAIESNRHAKRWLSQQGGELVGESYMPLGKNDFAPILQDVRRSSPDWIFSTVVGDSDLYFRKAYIAAGFKPDDMPTASLTTSEMEVKAMGAEFGENHILSAPYFQSLSSAANRAFVDSFLASPHGGSGVTHYNMEETYLAFLYFKKAVERIVAAEGTAAVSPSAIRAASAGLELSEIESPEGRVWIDPNNFNSWLTPKIGRFNSSGQIDILQTTDSPRPPMPYILYPERGHCLADGLHLPSGQVVKAAS